MMTYQRETISREIKDGIKEPELRAAHILFIDIVGYSKLKSDQQVKIMATLNQTVQKSITTRPDERRLILPTGDGMALAFLDNPESPLLVARQIAPIANRERIPLRMGMHTGPVYLLKDIKQQENIVGGGINLAQRVMDCGDAGHILASKEVANALSGVKEEYERLFHYLGEFEVKHGVKIEIYNVYGEDFGNSNPLQRMPKEPSKTLHLPPSLHNQTPPEPNFVGQVDKLKTITDWYKDPKVRIGALIGWGGVGKSALVRKWYDNLQSNDVHPDGIFWWGFYRNAYLDRFLDALLNYLAQGRIGLKDIKTTWQKVDTIKEYTLEGEYLIILDGLETMQKGEVSGEEFGSMAHPECTDMLRFLSDTKGNGLCLITTRFPLTDIKKYEGMVYQKKEIERLSIEDARALFEKVGVKGSTEEKDSVIEEYGGHALSLTLLSKYLVEDFGGDITKAKDIPPFHSDKEAGGKAHRILLWYASQLSEEQRAFMKIFSLFRGAVREEDFEGVFRAEMETKMNQTLRAMSNFSFKRMVDNLCDRRLISKGQDNAYATHPLIKNYFDSIFEDEDKKRCHKRIYHYIGSYAPDRPETLEEMQPLFEQVYHGCAAGLHQKTLDEVFYAKIDKWGEHYLCHKLGAWETELNLVRTYFPQGDLSQLPLVSNKKDQSWMLNEAGIALLAIGRPKEAEKLFIKKTNTNIEDKDFENACVGYKNLSELQFRIGELASGLESAKRALDAAEKVYSDVDICTSKAFVAWILYIMGKTHKANKEFKQADELFEKIFGYRLSSMYGIFYADFLLSMKRIDEAFELANRNLEICKNHKWVNDISRCHRCLGALDRIKGNHKKAEDHLQNALEIARTVGMPFLKIEALLEFARLYLDLRRHKDAIQSGNQVLKLYERTGFKLYEPEAEVVLGKAYLALNKIEDAKTAAQSAYEKATKMKYRWAEGDAAQLLGEVYLAQGEKEKAREWLEKAVTGRNEILDPEVKESERLLKGL
jgi:tetratricopeptide (TPR) repeat protein/class 3 adenylate cyclase